MADENTTQNPDDNRPTKKRRWRIVGWELDPDAGASASPEPEESGGEPPIADPLHIDGQRCLQEQVDSLPALYREVVEWLLDADTDWRFKALISGGSPDTLWDLVHIALDMLEIYRITSAGATVCIMTDDHREVVRECLLRGRDISELEEELGGRARALLAEAEAFLIPGALNLIEAALALPEPHRSVFCRVFFEGISPQQIAGDHPGRDGAWAARIFEEAIDRMASRDGRG